MIEVMGGLKAIVNAGEKVRTGQFLIFLYIDLVHIDANHPGKETIHYVIIKNAEQDP